MTSIKAIFIVGGSGFVGTHLAMRLRHKYKVFATYHHRTIKIPGVTYLPFNIGNKNWVKRVIYTTQPEAIIYAAGSNDFDYAEKNMRETEGLHSAGPATIAGSTEILQSRMIYLSNSYVFDGLRGNYHEADIVLPWTALGRMKLGGENVVKSKCLNYLIIRSSPVFGRSTGYHLSFLDRLRMNLDRNKHVEMEPHELHAFAPVDGLCEMVQRALESGIRNRVLHYGGLTKVSYFEFAKLFAAKFNYDPTLVIPKSNSQMKSSTNENHVFDFSLNFTQAIETLKIKPFLLEEGLDLIKQKLIPGS